MKTTLAIVAALAATMCIAAPHPHTTPHRAPHHPPIVHRGPALRPTPMPHHRHHSAWGRGGSNFWPGFVGGVIGSIVAPVVVPPPPPPVVIAHPVWVPPVYGTRPVYDLYGRIIRYEQYIITPGYWR